MPLAATVLDGAVIGESSIVGAGALAVAGSQIPPPSLVVGVFGSRCARRTAGTSSLAKSLHLGAKPSHFEIGGLAGQTLGLNQFRRCRHEVGAIGPAANPTGEGEASMVTTEVSATATGDASACASISARRIGGVVR